MENEVIGKKLNKAVLNDYIHYVSKRELFLNEITESFNNLHEI